MKNIILSIVIVTCLGIAGFRFFSGASSGNTARRDLANELATWIAKEAAAGKKGKTLVLAPPAESSDPFPGQLAKRLESQMKDAGFGPVVSSVVPYNTAIEGTGEPVTREAFLDVVRAHPDAAVIVSLVGVPRLTASDLPEQNRPRLIVASSTIMPYLKSFPPGLLDFAIEVKQDREDPRADASLGELSNYFVLHRPK